MSEERDQVQREVLPIPDRPPVGLTTFDAKDPDTSFPPIDAAAATGRVRPTCWWCCWTTPASVRPAPSVAR